MKRCLYYKVMNKVLFSVNSFKIFKIKEGHWIWNSGKTVVRRNWHSGEPNNSHGNEDCIEMSEGRWNDDTCSERNHYVCQVKI